MTSAEGTSKQRDFRRARLFTLISLLYSWPIFIVVDAWLVPSFRGQGNAAAIWLTALFGHMLAMAGPGVAAILVWRRYREPLPEWRWSRPGYYSGAALGMLALWTLPALVGLAFGDTLQVLDPIEGYAWVVIGTSLTAGWLAGLGEEVGWTAFLLPHLAPHLGKSRALVVAGAIRGVWHWPLFVGPLVAEVIAGEKTVSQLVVLSVALGLQLLISNALFGVLFGWVWYKTESLPLVGWLHQWFDAARDVTALLIVGYTHSLWFTRLWGIPFYLAAGLLLTHVAREEGANMWTLAPPKRPTIEKQRLGT